ncbi:MAG TPA: glycosyl hydrolase family 28-related protein, partial [Acidobacteriaceae bacterium]
MNNLFAGRRNLLKLSGLGLAGAAATLPLMAESADAGAPRPVNLVDVRALGAKGDGKTVDTPAINQAIETVAAAGGGVVFFPAGSYLCFSIRLRSQVELRLSRGSVIVAADSPLPGEATGYNGGVYDAAEPNTAWDPYQDYGHNHWHNSLLWGEELHDVSITGPGLIYGKGLSFGATRDRRGDYPLYTAEQAGVGNK